jgi:hypothetical protein
MYLPTSMGMYSFREAVSNVPVCFLQEIKARKITTGRKR